MVILIEKIFDLFVSDDADWGYCARYGHENENILRITELKILKRTHYFFIEAIQKTKRSTVLKIVFEKKALIDTNFGNACEYVTKCFGT